MRGKQAPEAVHAPAAACARTSVSPSLGKAAPAVPGPRSAKVRGTAKKRSKKVGCDARFTVTQGTRALPSGVALVRYF